MEYTEKLRKDIEKQKELITKLEESMNAVPANQKETQAYALKILKGNLALLEEHLAKQINQ